MIWCQEDGSQSKRLVRRAEVMTSLSKILQRMMEYLKKSDHEDVEHLLIEEELEDAAYD